MDPPRDEESREEAFRKSLVILESYGYRPISELGRGRFGRVVLIETRTGMRLAAKIVLEEDVHQGEDRYWRSLYNKNVLPLMDQFPLSDPRTMVFAMPKLDLPIEIRLNQYKYLRDKKDLDTAIGWLKNIVEGLKYLHSRNFCHMNLNCSDVLLYSDAAVIIDFGFLTTADTPVNSYGSPLMYRAPEAFLCDGEWTAVNGKEYDIWTLGLLALDMMTGQSVYRTALQNPELSRNWATDVYPVLKKILKRKDFRKTIRKSFRGSNIKKKKIELLLNFIKACLNVNPQERSTIETLIEHKIFGGNLKMSKPEVDIWKTEMHPDTLDLLIMKHRQEERERYRAGFSPNNSSAEQLSRNNRNAQGMSQYNSSFRQQCSYKRNSSAQSQEINENTAITSKSTEDAADINNMDNELTNNSNSNPEIKLTRKQAIINWFRSKKKRFLGNIRLCIWKNKRLIN